MDTKCYLYMFLHTGSIENMLLCIGVIIIYIIICKDNTYIHVYMYLCFVHNYVAKDQYINEIEERCLNSETELSKLRKEMNRVMQEALNVPEGFQLSR